MRHLRDFKALLALSIFVLVFAVACGGGQPETDEGAEAETAAETEPTEPEEPETVLATAELQGRTGSEIRGTVTFTQLRDGGPVTIQAQLQGVEGAGNHGFHIHEVGDCSAEDFTSAGGHFNPAQVEHACPPTEPRHAGDLGNLEIGEDGTGTLDQVSELVTLEPGAETSVIGKAVILHEGEDDCTSQPTGAAGARLACGVIEEDMSGDMGGDMEGEMDGDMEDEESEEEM